MASADEAACGWASLVNATGARPAWPAPLTGTWPRSPTTRSSACTAAGWPSGRRCTVLSPVASAPRRTWYRGAYRGTAPTAEEETTDAACAVVVPATQAVQPWATWAARPVNTCRARQASWLPGCGWISATPTVSGRPTAAVTTWSTSTPSRAATPASVSPATTVADWPSTVSVLPGWSSPATPAFTPPR